MRSEVKVALMNENELGKAIQSALSKTKKMQGENLEYYSIREACKILNCCRTTIYNWCKQGFLNYKKIGRRVLFSRKDLENCGSNVSSESNKLN